MATAVAADTAIDRSRIVPMSILLDLFLTFARIGLFTFGGGYAMISLIDRSCVEKKRWISWKLRKETAQIYNCE